MHKPLQKRELAMAGSFIASLATMTLLGHAIGFIGEGAHHAAPAENRAEGNILKQPGTPQERMAQRARERLERMTGSTYALDTVKDALASRSQLLERSMTVRVSDSASGESSEWTLAMKHYPWLVEMKHLLGRPVFTLNEDAFALLLREGSFEGSRPVRDSYVNGVREEKGVLRADAANVARAGFTYDDTAVQALIDHLRSGDSEPLALNAPYREGDVYMTQDDGTRTKLSLLSSGRSNFTDSPEARETNVHKAINEHVNNIVVEKGGTFSFNGTLGGPVTLDKGWVEALGLFGGGSAMTPGGGICQAATTVYRAAVLAGLPIVYKRNHSLYVTYYEQYGVGIDATIFPGVHDLLFRNDSPGTIVVQAYNEHEDSIVNIYGQPDGRTVALDGPYFAASRPRPPELRPLGYNDIGWVQRITYADGRTESSPIISRYAKPVPRSLASTYAPGTSDDLMHAAAPQPAL